MSLGERDPHTGINTTGHEWSGIKELDTPIPKAVKFFYGLTFLIALAMWILLPTWPLITTYTSGLLGFSQRDFVADQLAGAAVQRADWADRIAGLDVSEGGDDPQARAIAVHAGETLFSDNCAACHGQDGTGGPGFPNLTDGAWIWGGTPEDIHETLRVGINSRHDETTLARCPPLAGIRCWRAATSSPWSPTCGTWRAWRRPRGRTSMPARRFLPRTAPAAMARRPWAIPASARPT